MNRQGIHIDKVCAFTESWLRKMRDFDFDYDEENDDLFLYDKKGGYNASVEISDFVLDFDKEKRLVGIEIMNATNSINFTFGFFMLTRIIMNCRCQI